MRVAGALVRYEVERLGRGYGDGPSPFLTADTICRTYGLRGLWRRTIRASLRAAYKEGLCARVQGVHSGERLKLSGETVYVHRDCNWKELSDMGLIKSWTYGKVPIGSASHA